ncbi:MAG: DUF58 domain-containing protein [Desulfovibrio sp.]|jgi:uncharacterized protein (DUF58 family)|nr:DUF58 domain-containing protein [Desulfovibrio sp.]
MDRHELLAKITTLPLAARGLAEDLLSGDFRSVFKGQGIEFDEVRRYETGDDIRSIDWNVSARFGTPYVKMYREEREMTVCLILDNSASMHSASGPLSRWEQGVMAAALIAFSAEQAGQRVSAVFFDREIRTIFPPRKGRPHTMAMISAALEARPQERGSGLGSALTGAGRFLKRRSLAVIVSDFLCVDWEQEIGRLSRKHDVIALGITSPLDREMPDGGLLTLEDPETGVRLRAPSSFPSFRSAWASWHGERRRLWEAICRRSGAAWMELSTGEDAPAALLRYFRGRRQPGGPEAHGGV